MTCVLCVYVVHRVCFLSVKTSQNAIFFSSARFARGGASRHSTPSRQLLTVGPKQATRVSARAPPPLRMASASCLLVNARSNAWPLGASRGARRASARARKSAPRYRVPTEKLPPPESCPSAPCPPSYRLQSVLAPPDMLTRGQCHEPGTHRLVLGALSCPRRALSGMPAPRCVAGTLS